MVMKKMMMIIYDEMMIIMSLLYITCALVGKIGYCLMTAFIHLLSM